jgi:hypothetical protein
MSEAAKPSWTWFGWARRIVRWCVNALEFFAEAKEVLKENEKLREELDDLFAPAERLIYRYYTGTVEGQPVYRAIDPLPLYKKLMEKGPELDINLKVSQSASKDAVVCHGKLMDELRRIFDVADYEQGGLTDWEVRALFDHFLLFVGRQKKVGRTDPTSPGETGSATPTTSPSEPPTAPTSDSGSTESDSSTGPPSPSPKE